jgi:hypothetical protein
MECDDCGLETGRDANHATDADCMAALMTDRDRYRAALEKLLKHTECGGAPCPDCPAKEAAEILRDPNEEDK